MIGEVTTFNQLYVGDVFIVAKHPKAGRFMKLEGENPNSYRSLRAVRLDKPSAGTLVEFSDLDLVEEVETVAQYLP